MVCQQCSDHFLKMKIVDIKYFTRCGLDVHHVNCCLATVEFLSTYILNYANLSFFHQLCDQYCAKSFEKHTLVIKYQRFKYIINLPLASLAKSLDGIGMGHPPIFLYILRFLSEHKVVKIYGVNASSGIET